MLTPTKYDNHVHSWQYARQLTNNVYNPLALGHYSQWLTDRRLKIVSRYDYWHSGAQAHYKAVFNLHALVAKALAPC